MKLRLLIAGALFGTTLSAAGGTAAPTIRPRVGFVAYAGSHPTVRALNGLIGAAAMAGLVLLASGAVAGSRYGRRIPRARTSS
jgi:hypothetical protein